MTVTPVKRALLSVSNKSGLVEFAKELVAQGLELISTGGTAQALLAAQVPHRQVEELTTFPELFDGRVKTLHPKLHGGILGKRDKHAKEALQHDLAWIDLVVVNFYPFMEASHQKELTWEEMVEYIDIGGPTMVRAAAKNFAWVGAVTDPADYPMIVRELQERQGLSLDLRRKLAEKAFALTASYDAAIHAYFYEKEKTPDLFPKRLELQLEKSFPLRYGENPHQNASAYQFRPKRAGVLSAIQHQGKTLSFNNILDADAAWAYIQNFEMPTCAVIKHTNLCGLASAPTIHEAYQNAYQADSLSAFGGVLALNRPCSKETAQALTSVFMEIVMAPSYSEEALAIFKARPNLRVLELPLKLQSTPNMKFIADGVLLQDEDSHVLRANDLKVVTKAQPSHKQLHSLLFAWQVLKRIKSNAILIVREHQTVGIGAGQVSRIDAVNLAIQKAGNQLEGCVLASDAFFPFRDSIDRIGQTAVKVIIQPGGSLRDDEVIAACDEQGLAMVFTGKRCFRH